MIIGSLKNASRYFSLSDGIKKGIEFLLANDISKLAEGRYEVDGEKSWAHVKTITTKPESEVPFETHRKYIDLQMDIEGEEWFGYTPAEMLSAPEKNAGYDEATDMEFFSGKGAFFKLEKDQFIIFYPDDGHKPETTFKQPGKVRKLVVKIPVDE